MGSRWLYFVSLYAACMLQMMHTIFTIAFIQLQPWSHSCRNGVMMSQFHSRHNKFMQSSYHDSISNSVHLRQRSVERRRHDEYNCNRVRGSGDDDGGGGANRAAGGMRMCGVIGISLADPHAVAAHELYDGLTLLQHRGQDAAGISTSDHIKLYQHKGKGLARDIFGVDRMLTLVGHVGVGHVRYPTAGLNTVEEAQPFYNNVPFGYCLAHNGHITNAPQLRDQLSANCHLNTDSDTEVLCQLLGQELAAKKAIGGFSERTTSATNDDRRVKFTHRAGGKEGGQTADSKGAGDGGGGGGGGGGPGGRGEGRKKGALTGGGGVVISDGNTHIRTPEDDVFDVVGKVMARCRGGYAVVVLINGLGIVAFRDAHGIRPLSYGSRMSSGTSGKLDWAAASESVGITGLGFTLKGDIKAGEAIFINRHGVMHKRLCAPAPLPRFTPCIFEYVYMARPDSVLDGVSVYQARVSMGERLADKIIATFATYKQGDGECSDEDAGGGGGNGGGDSRRIFPPIDVVVPVPETSRIAAHHCASRLGVPYEDGLTKNRYIGRTFLMPGQELRLRSVRKKLAPVAAVLRGRHVLLVDDSIVRGTTSRQIISMVREAGATRVTFCSASPPVRHPNFYGVDLPTRDELLAHGLNEAQIADAIGADDVIFQDLEALRDCVSEHNPSLQSFEDSIFTGSYVCRDGNVEQAGAAAGGGGGGVVGLVSGTGSGAPVTAAAAAGAVSGVTSAIIAGAAAVTSIKEVVATTAAAVDII